jgi:hypothetical protein
MSNKTISIYSEALKRKQTEQQETPTPESTSNVNHSRDMSRDFSRGLSRDMSRGKSREVSSTDLRENSKKKPTRDEIQEFSFRLRDEINVKVQAELPHSWQEELEKTAQQLDVKKLELYRFIFGKFLDKV